MLITCGLYEKHYKSKFSSEMISSLNSLVNSLSVNKTYPFGDLWGCKAKCTLKGFNIPLGSDQTGPISPCCCSSEQRIPVVVVVVV